MSKLGERLLRSLDEALRHSRGEDVPGIKVHYVSQLPVGRPRKGDVRVHVTLPKETLDKIDEMKGDMSRYDFIRQKLAEI